MTSCLQGDPKPRPPIPPRGLSGPPRPAEGVIGVGTLTSMRGEEEKRRRGEEGRRGGVGQTKALLGFARRVRLPIMVLLLWTVPRDRDGHAAQRVVGIRDVLE